ncbi:hypothetical protein CCR75_002177 [Bremia lactucae]|uniref:Uncharacterized protein n=1 Tax=Bremia lactucae TaxID=4779 RepID=A0A976IH36_BRELC|nr:hypothetical protein CCR75_002177 [Bremia lactucae]
MDYQGAPLSRSWFYMKSEYNSAFHRCHYHQSKPNAEASKHGTCVFAPNTYTHLHAYYEYDESSKTLTMR